jgi:hypothetical protein
MVNIIIQFEVIIYTMAPAITRDLQSHDVYIHVYADGTTHRQDTVTLCYTCRDCYLILTLSTDFIDGVVQPGIIHLGIGQLLHRKVGAIRNFVVTDLNLQAQLIPIIGQQGEWDYASLIRWVEANALEQL